MNNDFIKLVDSEAGRSMMESSGSFFGLVAATLTLLKDAKAIAREMLEDAWRAARAAQPDAIIFHPKALAGSHIAEKLGIPAMMAVLVPAIVPTGDFVATGFPNLPLGAGYRKLSYSVLHWGYHLYDDVVNQFRQDTLGLDRLPKSTSPLQMAGGQPIEVLHGYSEHLSPRPLDWPASAHITGYWFLEKRETYQPPVELANFLAAGEPPVYVGFGSMAGRHPQRVAETVAQALKKAKVRGILATGWGGMAANHLQSDRTQADIFEDIFVIDKAPHDWLFPRVAAVVHHGGAGTTAAGLRAGKPAVICPFLVDQPYWGERVYALSAGSKPIPQKQLTAENLAAAIREVITSRAIRENAEALGEKIRNEDGTGRAIALIEQSVRTARTISTAKTRS